MDQYIYSCLDLVSKADKGMKAEKKIKAIIRGLLPHYFHQTLIKKFVTVAELITHLQSLEDAQYVYDRKQTITYFGKHDFHTVSTLKGLISNNLTIQR